MLEETTRPSASQPTPDFDAPSWFSDWSDHGGVAMLAGDRLYLGRSPAVDRIAHQRLDRLREQLLHQRAGSALADLLRRRSFGETEVVS